MRRAFFGSGVGLVLLFGGVGALHSPAAKPVLRWLTGGHCPIGMDLPPATRETARLSMLRTVLGEGAALERTALGLPLGTAHRDDVDQWAADRGARCAADRAGLLCEVASDGERVRFGFDPDGRLVAVGAESATPDPGVAAARYTARAGALAGAAGPPTTSRGTPQAVFLAAAPLRQAATSFRFADYRVELTATNLGPSGFVVRETHQVP